MKTVIGWIGVLATFVVKLPFVLLGLVVVPLTDPVTNPIWGNKLEPFSPSWHMRGRPDWWANYVWRAIRNPVNNLRFLLREPDKVWDGAKNVDMAVRNSGRHAAWRRVDGWLPEFWYLRRLSNGTLFEFRIGWKYSGVPGFDTTIQLRWER